MRPTKLNLSQLRSPLWPRLRSGGAGAHGPADGELGLSRRQLLGLAGLVAASLLPGVRNIKLPRGGPFALVADERRTVFLLGSQERFVIHVDQFAGAPKLRVTEQGEGYRVELTGARYPGTDVPADLVADLERHGSAWSMHLQMAFGGFDAVVPLEEWLAGLEPARSAVRMGEAICRLGGEACLAAAGTARAEFRPDWTLRLAGTGVGQVAGLGGGISGDALLLSLLTPFDASIMRQPAPRRSLLTVERGANEWSLLPAMEGLGVGQAFANLHVEAGESARGRARYALIAEGEGSLQYRPAEAVGLDGQPVALTLDSPRFAMAPGESGEEAVLTAAFAGQPAWVRGPGLHYLVGGAPEAGPFTARWRDGALEEIDCAPPVLQAAAPLEGAFTQVHLPRRPVFADLTAPPTAPLTPRTPANNAARQKGVVLPLELPLSVTLVRPQDLLNLRFEFRNLKLQTDGQGGSELVRKTASQPAYLIVHFPPQHVAEQAFQLTADEQITGITGAPAKARLAGPSRLVFALPADRPGIPFTVAGLLSWQGLVPSVAPAATGGLGTWSPDLPNAYLPPFDAATTITAPAETHTAIEAPYRLVLSPTEHSGWKNDTLPVTHGSWTELWHTRLGSRSINNGVDELAQGWRVVRAIWSPDYQNTAYVTPFSMSLDADTRHQLVGLSARRTGGPSYKIDADRLMLSPLGAWLDLSGDFLSEPGFSLRQWRHVAVQGRDQFVRVVKDGYLFPFRHKAAYISISERRIVNLNGKRTAYLIKREFVIVREPEQNYTTQTSKFAHEGREWPFKKVRILNGRTPNLDPITGLVSAGSASLGFWPKVGGTEFAFRIAAEDAGGNQIEFTMPLAFIDKTKAEDLTLINKAKEGLAGGLGKRFLEGKRLHFAPPSTQGDTEFQTAWIQVESGQPSSGEPRFFPLVKEASVHLPAVAQLSGADPGYQKVKLAAKYLEAGFGTANRGGIFLELPTALPTGLPGAVTGGLATPNFSVTGISRAVGLVGGPLADFAGGAYNPTGFFSPEAKLLGGIKLQSLLVPFTGGEFASRSAEVPNIKSRLLRHSDGKPKAMETTLSWVAPVNNASEGFVEFVKTSATRINTNVKATTRFDNTPNTYEVTSSLNNFTVKIMSSVAVNFTRLQVKMLPGQKPAVDVQLAGVEFLGALRWVSVLTEFLARLGLGGFDIDVDSYRLRLVQSVGPLNIQLGMLALSDVNLRTELLLPFRGDNPVSLAFNFGSEEAPCGLTVSFLGGKAYFGLVATTRSLTVGAFFGFGGSVAFDIGVASGKMEIIAGIRFLISTENEVMVEGSLQCCGALRIIRLITLSISFLMALRYEAGKVIGSCEVKVKVEIAFFEKSVTLRLERKFAGSAGDPSFKDLMDTTAWNKYCQAFA